MEKDYIPISCSFYDHLEAWATLKEEVNITFKNELDEYRGISGIIMDFTIMNQAEYLILQSGLQIRLDRIIEINNLKIQDFKKC
ncbi:MAG: hypothetical protein KDC53_11230 [Saprospiraceae bacterium]|nr:hypothetical protein [Saprospiraceae bacterium]